MPLLPFTIDDVPDAVIDLTAGTGIGVARRGAAAPVAPRSWPDPPVGAGPPWYVYRGPFGPVYESYEQPPDRTHLYGDHVPCARFELGAPRTERTTAVTAMLRAGIDGAIGDRAVRLRLDPDTTPRVRRLDIAVGDDRYALVAAGLLPRVGLHRADHDQLAVFTVRGWRPHRIAADATDVEVVLAAFVVRFALRLAHQP